MHSTERSERTKETVLFFYDLGLYEANGTVKKVAINKKKLYSSYE
jgi:hypothetical protein